MLISLHPSMNIEEYLYLERTNVKIARLDVVSVIYHTNLYIASVSTTIVHALALGVPVINYDVYRYSEEIEQCRYEESSCVYTAMNKVEYESYIQKILSSDYFLETLKNKQSKYKSEWGVSTDIMEDNIRTFL